MPLFGFHCALLMITVVTFDAWYFWTHRWLHRTLCRLHAVHHEVGVKVQYHWQGAAHNDPLEELFIVVYVTATIEAYKRCIDASIVPWGLLVGYGLIALWAPVLHSSPSVSAPGGVLMDPSKHYVHHRLPHRNFGYFFTAWDRVCGTYQSTVKFRPFERTNSTVVVPKWRRGFTTACWMVAILRLFSPQ